jgi:hypothetical protein
MSTEALSPTWFAPRDERAHRATILIAPAMAVRQDDTTPFDRRYAGFNAPKSLRGIRLDFDDWADDVFKLQPQSLLWQQLVKHLNQNIESRFA